MDSPEDRSNNGIQSKGAGIEIVLVPNALADGEAIVGSMDSVVDRHDYGQGPGNESEDLVGRDGAMAV